MCERVARVRLAELKFPDTMRGCASDLHRPAVRSFSRVNLKRCVVIIQVASDLHHEIAVSGSRLAQPLQPAPGADVLVLAGDIHSGTAGIELYSDYPDLEPAMSENAAGCQCNQPAARGCLGAYHQATARGQRSADLCEEP
jgi:hypothetical protein